MGIDLDKRKPRWMTFKLKPKIFVPVIALLLVLGLSWNWYRLGYWDVEVTTDPITDEQSVDATIESNDIEHGTEGITYTDNWTLGFTCKHGIRNVVLGNDVHYTTDYLFRFDGGKPLGMGFIGKDEMPPNAEDVPLPPENKLFEQARKSKKLVVRVFGHGPAEGEHADVFFNLRGAEYAFEKLDRSCKK
jgi:hypothetical protein